MTFKDIEAQIILSELQLAAALFEEAAETSLALLRSLSGEDREQRSRCSFVLQQSFFELGRFPEVLDKLISSYGGGLEAINSKDLLLWCSLAAEVPSEKEKATSVLYDVLTMSLNSKGQNGESHPQWTSQELSAGAALLTIELWAKNGEAKGKALEWIESTQGLPEDTKQVLRAAVRDAEPPSHAICASGAPTGKGPTVAHPTDAHSEPSPGSAAHPRSAAQDKTSCDGSPETEDRGEQSHFSAAQGLIADAVDLLKAQYREVEKYFGPSMTPAAASCAGAVAAVLCYAAYSERKAIRRGVLRAASFVGSGIIDMFQAGLSLNPGQGARASSSMARR